MSQPESFDLWQHKPWWCQPWSILATGTLTIAGTGYLSRQWWLVVPVGIAVCLWWFYFLIAVPRLLAAQAEGLADTVRDRPQPDGSASASNRD